MYGTHRPYRQNRKELLWAILLRDQWIGISPHYSNIPSVGAPIAEPSPDLILLTTNQNLHSKTFVMVPGLHRYLDCQPGRRKSAMQNRVRKLCYTCQVAKWPSCTFASRATTTVPETTHVGKRFSLGKVQLPRGVPAVFKALSRTPLLAAIAVAA
jgi:hypothetical protein